MTLEESLKYHFLRYRRMTPQDTVKLIYQSEFGCGHMIADKDSARRYLSLELGNTPRDACIPPVEYLGAAAARVNLASTPDGLSERTLFRIFFESSTMFSGNEKSFESKLGVVFPLIDSGYTTFSRHDYTAYLEKYFREGGGAVHHSLPYSSAYRPAYRVIHASFAVFIGIFARIDRLLTDGKRRFAVVIDGRCGSGKTTLSSLLSRVYGCGIVHADDYWLPFSERHGQLGGLDAERMRREITSGRDSFVSRVYDPHRGEFIREENVAALPFFVVEGSYAASVDVGIRYALSVFLTVGADEQLRRISERSAEKLDDFKEKWIPNEEQYFKEYDVEHKCDIVVNTDI